MKRKVGACMCALDERGSHPNPDGGYALCTGNNIGFDMVSCSNGTVGGVFAVSRHVMSVDVVA